MSDIDVSQLRFHDDRGAKLQSFMETLLRLTVRLIVGFVAVTGVMVMVVGALMLGVVRGLFDASRKR